MKDVQVFVSLEIILTLSA